MADAEKEPDKQEKTLEMRVAELEDRLSQVHITEDEMKAYRKVAGLLGQTGASAAGGSVAGGCVVDCVGCINECGGVIRQRPGIIRQPIVIRQCTWECFECGPGLPGAGGIGGFTQFGG
jgi:hypothetical protein